MGRGGGPRGGGRALISITRRRGRLKRPGAQRIRIDPRVRAGTTRREPLFQPLELHREPRIVPGGVRIRVRLRAWVMCQ